MTVVTDVDVPFIGSGKVLVLKLFGDLAQRDKLVLTDSDQRGSSSACGRCSTWCATCS